MEYTVTPGNFATLPEAEQRKKVGAFLELLRAMTKPARITLARKVLRVPVGGSETGMPVLQVRLSSPEPLGRVLESLRYDSLKRELDRRRGEANGGAGGEASGAGADPDGDAGDA